MSVIKCKGVECNSTGRCRIADIIRVCYIEKLKNNRSSKFIATFNFSDVKYLVYIINFSKSYFETILFDHLNTRQTV